MNSLSFGIAMVCSSPNLRVYGADKGGRSAGCGTLGRFGMLRRGCGWEGQGKSLV